MNEINELAEVKVFRFDHLVDKEPRYDLYQVPFKGLTVLNILDHINQNCDGRLTYRKGCLGKGSARCGACTIMVNGAPALSCRKAAEREMVLEPHPRFAVIKDLVTDFSRKQRLSPVRQPAVRIKIDAAKCVGCGDCVRLCPAMVYNLVKIEHELKASAVLASACCGMTCLQCMRYCWKDAISITP